MPVSSDHFYNIKRLHAVFALSSLALLAVTIWMLAADHRRQWKVYQRTFRDQVEPWWTEARLLEQRAAQAHAHAQGLAEKEAGHRAVADRLERSLAEQRPRLAKDLLGLPLIDALGRPLSIEQTWLPELTINYHFRRVARFDRCATCHRGIDKTSPGTVSEPAYGRQTTVAVELATPAEVPELPAGQGGDPEQVLRRVYGLVLAPRGILDPNEPTVQLVLPGTAAALADLRAGDVLLSVDGEAVASRAEGVERLGRTAEPAGARRLEVRRGLAQPYASHPRLDLFVGSHSPHPASAFGCTICHEGQGSATEFAWASHTPDDPADGRRWRREHGWVWNPDWDFPMRPKRLLESSCLRCHPEVSDLEPSGRFPDPPAPKLLAGYHLVRQLGCFGCHEIRGFDESGERIGPDMRLEPSSDGGALPSSAHARAPGTMRKVGPSLRNLADKLDARFLESFLRHPAGFRPDTRMPQLFGLHEHLSAPEAKRARRLEAVEVHAIAEYLLSRREAAFAGRLPDASGARAGLTGASASRAADRQRGKALFLRQGCLACHRHGDFPEAQPTVGADLSRLGAKLTSESARQWLVEWLRDPARLSPRTVMPNPLLEPDAAADIAEYLLAPTDWQAEPRPALLEADLDELALLHLGATFSPAQAGQYLREGIPESMAGQVPADAQELLGRIDRHKKLRYVARRTIRKRGCYGCHDLAGFEEAQPIGPALSDWGRKPLALLAFERIGEYVIGQRAGGSGQEAAESPAHPSSLVPRPSSLVPRPSPLVPRPSSLAPRPSSLAPRPSPDASRQAFFAEALLAHRREGFLWQKLRAPRSFDYQVSRNKGFNEHLVMGRFALSDAEVEAIATFVLGLVAEPPAARYVHQPQGRTQAIVEGRKVLDQYGCGECHVLGLERWTFQYDPATFPAPRETPEYPFLKPQVTAERLAASRAVDRRGLCQVEVIGMPRVDAQGKLLEDEDDEGRPLYLFDLWEPAVIAGKVWSVGGAQVPVAKAQLTAVRAPWGGALARLLYPSVLAEAKAGGVTVADMAAWGWLPPPLAHEGRKVEPRWLHDYVLNPVPIRPAAVLRMPRYNLSSAEAGKLADYFAAACAAEAPYSVSSGRRDSSQTAIDSADAERLAGAMRILTDRKTFCAKCHAIGDFTPGGEVQTSLAPNLEGVGRRLRPEYLRQWLANPKSVLPYTAMPVNFPPTGEPLGQDLYRAASREQLDAVVDLLVNYDWYMKRRTSIRTMIESAHQKPK